MKNNIELYKRNAVFSEIGSHCYLSGEHDYIEITEWHNGDGFDVDLNSKSGIERISFTWGQLKLFKKMVKKFMKRHELMPDK